METKTDFSGNPLSVGDVVVFVKVGGKGLRKGTITKLNPKRATIECQQMRMNYNGNMQVIRDTCNRDYDLLVKLDKPTIVINDNRNGIKPNVETTENLFIPAISISGHIPPWELRTSDERK